MSYDMVRSRGLNDSTVSFAKESGYWNWCIPEYHDDQRFQNGNPASDDYGPVAHTLAWPKLATLQQHTQFDGRWVNVGIVTIDELSTLTPYQDLGLTTLHSCLYLQHYDPGTGDSYYAGLMSPATRTGCRSIPTGGTTLEVVEERYSDNQEDYPAVTRFVEGKNNTMLVGVRCANRWCVVGPGIAHGHPEGVPEHAHHAHPVLNSNSRGVVKGWFDDQVLGAPDAAGSHGILRKRRGSLIPDPLLPTLAIRHYLAGWQTVARAYFDNNPTEPKYNKATKGPNIIQLRAEIGPLKPDNTRDTTWYARIVNDEGVLKDNIPVTRMDHSKWLSEVPATARWRWRDTDEDVWIACDVGCCMITNAFM